MKYLYPDAYYDLVEKVALRKRVKFRKKKVKRYKKKNQLYLLQKIGRAHV